MMPSCQSTSSIGSIRRWLTAFFWSHLLIMSFVSQSLQAQEEADSEQNAEEQVFVPKTIGASDDEQIFGEDPIDSKSLLTRAGFWIILMALLVIGFTWLNRKGFFRNRSLGGHTKRLVIEETTSLGNRQYLVVARHKNQSMLLGVGQGFIHHLKDLELDSKEDTEPFKLEDDD